MSEREGVRRAAEILEIPEDCFYSDSCLHEGMFFNIDGYSASESLLPWMSLSDWGWKALVAAFSDVVASGGVPLLGLYSIGVRSVEEGIEIAKGVKEASRWLDIRVLGGDFNRCTKDLWIDVVAVGRARGFWLRWNSATPGLKVIQVGHLGFGAITHLLLKGELAQEDVPKDVMDYIRRPKPPLVELAKALGTCNARAAIDNSDGWAWSLRLVSEASDVGVEIDEILVPDEIVEVIMNVRAKGVNPLTLLLNSAEDYNYAIFATEEEAECIVDVLKKMNVPVGVVGRTLSDEKNRVLFSGVEISVEGWDSFRSF